MFDDLLDLLGSVYDWPKHRQLIESLYEQEKWFDTPHQLRSAELARDALLAAGLKDVKIAPFPADGKTRFQDWTTHMAWDCPAAQLSITGGPVLADRNQVTTSVVYWSGPLAKNVTPGVLPKPEPVTAGVVNIDELAEITPADVAGKYALTGKYPQEARLRLLAAKALPLAIVSDFVNKGIGYDDDTVKWCNAWSDDPGGWYNQARDTVLPGIVLSPRMGRVLRERLAADPNLTLTGFVQSRLYAGKGQNLSAVLEGTDPSKEIWIYGHACECGADDNVSGVAALVETLRLIQRLIQAGKLPRPRCSIRAISTEECLGMLAYATLHDDERRRALAGLNADNVGCTTSEAHVFNLHFGSLPSSTIAWPVAGLLAQTLMARTPVGYVVKPRRTAMTADDMISDPHAGVPSMWLGIGKDCPGYHSSSDDMRTIDPTAMRNNTLLTAAWAYLMATMDDASAKKLVAPACKWLDQYLVGGEGDRALLTRWAAGKTLRDLARWGVSPAVYEAAAAQYAPAGAEPLPDLPTDGPHYRRTTWGTCTFETLPPDQCKGLGRWSDWQTVALCWNNGRWSIPAIERLTKAECGKLPAAGLAPLYEACLAAGLMVKE